MIIININKKTSNDLKMVFRMVATEIKNLRKKSVLLLPDSVFEATSHYLHCIYKIGSKTVRGFPSIAPWWQLICNQSLPHAKEFTAIKFIKKVGLDRYKCMFDGLLTGTTAIWPPGPDKGKAANFWLTWKPSESASTDMLKFRTLSILLLLCMGVPWRCLNFDVRAAVKVFRGFVEGSASGPADDVNLLTVCWVCWELASSFGDSLDSLVECLNTTITKIPPNYPILHYLGNLFTLYLSCWMAGHAIKNPHTFPLLQFLMD